MGTLTGSSSSFSTVIFRVPLNNPSMEYFYRNRIPVVKSGTTSCGFLCREIFRKRRRTSTGDFGKLMMIKSSYSNNDDGGEGEDKENSSLTAATKEDTEERRSGGKDFDSEDLPGSTSSRQPIISSVGSAYNNFQVDSFKLMELLGPEKVDPLDVKIIKEKLFGYSTFWVTREEPFGDLGEGILFLGNLRGKREEVFSKLQTQLAEVMGDKYNLFMVEEPNSEGPDPRGGPRVSFGLLRKEVSEPGPTTLWQYIIALLLFLLTIGSSVELGIASQINRLPPEIVKYFTDPNAIEPPDMQLLLPFVESALPLAYGVLGVQLFHVVFFYQHVKRKRSLSCRLQ